MSLTPIWDATLADAPVNIWQASNIFPRPVIETFQEAMTRRHPQFAKGGYVGQSTPTDPANLGIVS